MSNIFARGLKLFDGIINKAVDNYPTFLQIKSVFSDEWYNFIVPLVPPTKLDWPHAKTIIAAEKIHGISMSYYIPDQYIDAYKQHFLLQDQQDNLSSDIYISKKVDQELSPVGKLILIDDQTITTYIKMAKTCFPEWANNEEYALHMYDHQKNNTRTIVLNYLLVHNNEQVGFCGLIGSTNTNLAYFHNTGVLPQFRRKGYFTAIIQHLIKVTKSLGIHDTYALVEQDSGSYHGLLKLGYSVEDKYHLFSSTPH